MNDLTLKFLRGQKIEISVNYLNSMNYEKPISNNHPLT